MKKVVVLITGALSGIGRATALKFAREGASVVVSGRRDAVGLALAAELRTTGSDGEYFHADVRREDDIRTLIDRTVERFGRIDVAVNNAGTEGTPGLVVDQSAETFAQTFDTNVLGLLLSMKHEIRVMLAQRHGSIVNVSSAYGRIGAAYASVYVASKHAVEGLTKSAALEVAGTGVRINAVAPGPIDTGMLARMTGTAEAMASVAASVPLMRAGTAREVADAIAFLASEKASFMTGASLAVDGAMTA
jgi:NAD(P)-dependent dehydrogenase (short-subunit alcohol dehydrogenase family)